MPDIFRLYPFCSIYQYSIVFYCWMILYSYAIPLYGYITGYEYIHWSVQEKEDAFKFFILSPFTSCFKMWYIHMDQLKVIGVFPYLLATIPNVVRNIHVQIFVWTYVFISFAYICKGMIAGSYGNSMFNPLRNCQTV